MRTLSNRNQLIIDARLVKYIPGSLQSQAFYIASAAMVHALFCLARGTMLPHNSTTG